MQQTSAHDGRSTATDGGDVGASSSRLSYVVENCDGCLDHNPVTGRIRVSLGGGGTPAHGTAFALLDLKGSQGVVHVHDEVGLGAGQTPHSDLTILRVTDTEHRVVYGLQIAATTRILRFVSPPGSLNATPLDLSTRRVVPNDGRSELAVDVTAKTNGSVSVRVNDRMVISTDGLHGGQAGRQRYVEAGILSGQADLSPLTVIHNALAAAVTPSDGTGEDGTVVDTTVPLAPTASRIPPTNLTPPRLSGTTVEGSNLTLDTGTWIGADSTQITWNRCAPDGSNCQPIPGAAGASYTLTGADVGTAVQARVVGLNDAGSAIAVSSPSNSIAAAAPVGTTEPSLVGSQLQGTTLTAQAGTWKWLAGPITYSWQECDADGSHCTPIAGGTGSALKLGADDVGQTIAVVVTAPGFRGSTTKTVQTSGPVRPSLPVNLMSPILSGSNIVGSVVTAVPGTWSQPAPEMTYAWQRCAPDGSACSPIPGATDQSYLLSAADAGSTIRVAVTGTNVTGTVTAASTTIPVIPPAPASVTAPAVSGDLFVGSVLTADTGSWSDPSATLTTTWKRCLPDGSSCTAINGATGNTYTLTADDLGTTIQLLVTATNPGGTTTATAATTATITTRPQTP